MTSKAGVIVVGAGQAGVQVALSLRQLKYAAPITVFGDEPAVPYQRPPLSKAFMLGKVEETGMVLRNPAVYQQQDVALRTNVHVEAIDGARRQVVLRGGERCDYDKLVLATGTRNRELTLPGATLDGVCYLRTLDEARHLRERLAAARHVVVIGGGFIGLEFAAVAASMERQVSVVELAPRLMGRAISEPISAYFEGVHRDAGSDIRCATQPVEIEGEGGRVMAVRLASGERLAADLVVIGIGVLPNVELAERAGIATGNGIHVDARLQTSEPDVFALGDCARFPSRFGLGAEAAPIRLESVQNAVDQARHLAAVLCGSDAAYASVPWFWSDQFDSKLQIAGLTCGATRHVSVEADGTGGIGVHCFDGERWLGFESVNRPAEHMAVRKLLAGATPPDYRALEAVGFDVRTLAKSLG